MFFNIAIYLEPVILKGIGFSDAFTFLSRDQRDTYRYFTACVTKR